MLDVTIRITGDDDHPLDARDLAVLAALGGNGTVEVHLNGSAPERAKPESAKVAERLQEAKPEPAAKAAPAKAAPAKAAPAKAAAPKAEPKAETPAPAEDDAEAQLELAVSRATALINGGNADKLRGILGEIGVKRVSELAGDDLTRFLAETAE